MPTKSDARQGMFFMIAACAVFAIQDGVSRFVAESASVYMVVMLRFWFFGLLALMWAARNPSGFRAAVATAFPKLQILRGVLLITEICVIMIAFVTLGLIGTHAVFICYPLIVTALSVVFLKEQVGWRRWLAITAGFIGVLIIIQPNASMLTFSTLLPLVSATLFAVYSLLTRYVSRSDSANVSFFWTGAVGAVASTPVGLWHWQSIDKPLWIWIAALCLLAILGNWLLIKAYDAADASSVQPFTYFHLPFVSLIGLFFFQETVRANVLIGVAIVIASGLFTFWRTQKVSVPD